MTDPSKDNKTDPGWNDPPMLHYSPSNPPPKSRITNKRIAFPLSSQSIPTASNAILTTIPTVPQPSLSKHDSQFTSWDSDARLKEVNETIDKLLATDDSSGDIMKRLGIMKDMWTSAKLNVDCQRKVWHIFNMLNKNDFEEADKLQLQLVMDHGSECASWTLAIRHLIQKLKL